MPLIKKLRKSDVGRHKLPGASTLTFERISSNPKIYGGKPRIKGTRITVSMVLELLEDGLSFKEITRDYYLHITKEDIRACLAYAKKTA
jgi:uncharacterized protein (DUF433 family)